MSLDRTEPAVRLHSPSQAKIALFRFLFRGREDVFARRFESRKTGMRFPPGDEEEDEPRRSLKYVMRGTGERLYRRRTKRVDVRQHYLVTDTTIGHDDCTDEEVATFRVRRLRGTP